MSIETWSLVGSGVSVLLGVIAIALSLVFYIQGNRANLRASNTLTKVETLVSTIQQHAFGMLEQTIMRISPGAPLPLTQATTTESNTKEPAVESNSGDGQGTKLDAEMKALNNLYAAEMSLYNPMYAVVTNLIGGNELLAAEHERLRALIAIKRTQLEKEYGVKFDGQRPPEQALPVQSNGKTK